MIVRGKSADAIGTEDEKGDTAILAKRKVRSDARIIGIRRGDSHTERGMIKRRDRKMLIAKRDRYQVRKGRKIEGGRKGEKNRISRSKEQQSRYVTTIRRMASEKRSDTPGVFNQTR